MKSEHRHDLKTNELGRLAEQVRPVLDKYGTPIMIGLVVVILTVTGTIWWSNTSSASKSAGWTEMADALSTGSAENFANVADKFAGTAIGDWARLNEAESHLQSGIQLSFTDRQSGISDLEQAGETFKKVLNNKQVLPEVRERAWFGYARSLEAMADFDTDEAVDTYELLLQEFPESIYKELAEKRIAVLKTGEAKQFYAWFQKQNPRPDDRRQPLDGFQFPESTDKSESPLFPESSLFPEMPTLPELPTDGKNSDEGDSVPVLPSPGKQDAEPNANDVPAKDAVDGRQGPVSAPKPKAGENSGRSKDAPPAK
jgi:hypothetical protein